MRRVSVVGASGSGKSTLAREIATRLGVPCVELDAIFNQPGWTPLPDDEFARRVAAAAAGDGWVIDGNYSRVRHLVWARADTVIWLDLPRRVVMRCLAWRTIRRVATRAELWNGNRERWRNLFSLSRDRSILAWSWHHYPVLRERYGAAMRDPAYSHLAFVRVTGRAGLRQLLEPVSRPELAAGYEDAWRAWEAAGDAQAWQSTDADGL